MPDSTLVKGIGKRVHPMARWLLLALAITAAFTAGCTIDRGQDWNGPFEGAGVDYDPVADRDTEAENETADMDRTDDQPLTEAEREALDVLVPGDPQGSAPIGPRGPVT